MERKYQWFVEPLSIETNAILARELSEENFLREVPDENGLKHNFWSVPYRLLSSLRNSGLKNNIKFEIYVREGNGKIRSARFLSSKLGKKKTASVFKV